MMTMQLTISALSTVSVYARPCGFSDVADEGGDCYALGDDVVDEVVFGRGKRQRKQEKLDKEPPSLFVLFCTKKFHFLLYFLACLSQLVHVLSPMFLV